MTARHVNIPLFVVHMGCPNQCVFCDQRLISGTSCFTEENAEAAIRSFLARPHPPETEAEIAFFGGSFTGIDRALMVRLLDLAQSYVGRGGIRGIRLSTRPDYIDAEILRILSRYSIRAVELGIQSLSDTVLTVCRRGHTSDDAVRACTLLAAAEIPFVGQMMLGLPASTPDTEKECARRLCELGASAYRVYPTVVFQGTELSSMTRNGCYTPLTDGEAACRMADVMEIFADAGVPCLRAGLCESESLHAESSYAAGPNHPALGELARSELLYRRIRQSLDGRNAAGRCVTVTVARGLASCTAGQHRGNIRRMERDYGVKSVKIIENPAQIGYNITIDVS